MSFFEKKMAIYCNFCEKDGNFLLIFLHLNLNRNFPDGPCVDINRIPLYIILKFKLKKEPHKMFMEMSENFDDILTICVCVFLLS